MAGRQQVYVDKKHGTTERNSQLRLKNSKVINPVPRECKTTFLEEA